MHQKHPPPKTAVAAVAGGGAVSRWVQARRQSRRVRRRLTIVLCARIDALRFSNPCVRLRCAAMFFAIAVSSARLELAKHLLDRVRARDGCAIVFPRCDCHRLDTHCVRELIATATGAKTTRSEVGALHGRGIGLQAACNQIPSFRSTSSRRERLTLSSVPSFRRTA